MKINFKTIIAFTVVLTVQFSFAQKKQENIKTEEVNVVKPYTPAVSDAFKIKENPVLDEEDNSKKETIQYNIFSFPVASTFTPSKGKAEGVEKEKQKQLFSNYATLGIGNYGTLNAELFVNQELSNTEYIAGMFRHLSSQGGIKGVELKNYFYDTSIDLTYGIRERDFSWHADLGYQNQIYNWYGLPADFANVLTPNDRDNLIAGIHPKQSYNTIYLGGAFEMEETVFKGASLKFNHFSDAYGSLENRFYAKPSFAFEIDEMLVKTDITLDYLGGSFKKNYENNNINPIKYGFANFGIAPSFEMNQDDWTLNVGVALFYSLDFENKNNSFYVYPKFNASYKVVDDLMIFYAGAEGGLEQNTYSDFVSQNPYVSPTLAIAPTNTQYDVFAGLRGKLTSTISYTLRASFVNEKNKALFKSNDYSINSENENYAFGNSMQVVYDDLKTLRFYGELNADISEDITLGIDGAYSSYTTDLQSEAWNLPALKLNAKAAFNISEQWFIGANVFYIGARKDQKTNTDLLALQNYLVGEQKPITLAGYLDLDAHLGFRYNERLTAFLRANNITNKSYEKWLDYPVQGFQVVLGANYKFDF